MSAVEIIECDQGSDEWYAARLGLPTASEFATVLAKGKDGGPSVTRRTYLHKLAGEVITGQPCENYNNAYMDRGKALEAEARDLYGFVHSHELRRVGFVRNGPKGCSPDALIGANGGLEIKTAAPHVLIPILLRNEFPPEHKAQVQGNLWVSEREWWDLAIYFPKMPLFVKRSYRDEGYIKILAANVEQFNDDLAEIVGKLKQYDLRDAA